MKRNEITRRMRIKVGWERTVGERWSEEGQIGQVRSDSAVLARPWPEQKKKVREKDLKIEKREGKKRKRKKEGKKYGKE